MMDIRKESKANSMSKRTSKGPGHAPSLGPKLSTVEVGTKKHSEVRRESHRHSHKDHHGFHEPDYHDDAHRLSFESHLMHDSSSPLGDESTIQPDLSTLKSINIDNLRHDLRPRESDVLFLKRRILYPGIFDQESDSEVDDDDSKRKKVRTLRTTCKVDRISPFVVKEGVKVERAREAHIRAKLLDPNPDLISCGTSTQSRNSSAVSTLNSRSGTFGGRKASGQESIRGDRSHTSVGRTKPYEPPKITRIGKPQNDNICVDKDIRHSRVPHPKMSSSILRKKESKIVGTDVDSNADLAIHESVLSLNEVLCMLEERSKKPPTLKERYIGHKRVPGHPSCLDKSKGYPECMPPGEIVRNAVDTWKLWGIPENVPLTREQLARVMKKMENHPNNDYVCLVYALPFSYPDFDPYDFKIVKYNHVGGRIHYTMSRYGALFISHGMVEYTSMLEFQSQNRIYDKLKSIAFFATYRAWKAFNIWHSRVRRQKMALKRNSLVDKLFTSKRPLRLMVLELCKIIEKVSKLTLLRMKPGETYGLVDFTELQMDYLQVITKRLRALENVVIEMTAAACRATLNEEGFSPDKYDEEMEFYLAKLHVPIPDLEKGLAFNQDKSDEKNYPGQWLSFLQQRKKRQICKRLAEFIRLVDYLVQRTYYKLLKNSIFTLALEMQSRIQYIPESFELAFEHHHFFDKLKNRVNIFFGIPALSGNEEPIFDIGCSWNDEDLVFSPSIAEYIKGFRGILACWRQAVLSYQNVLSLSSFHPYTQPILNGYVDRRTCGDGPNPEMLLDSDKDLEDLAMMVELILQHGFRVSDKYIKNFNSIRIFCMENQKQNLEAFRKETDALVFQKWLEKYTAQIDALSRIDDLKNMGVFRVNNSILRAHANPTIDRCLNVIRETIPVVGGRWVVLCDDKMREAIKTIETYPDTADNYVSYLLYLEGIYENIDDIENDWDNCSELFELMEIYEIPPQEGDLDAFKQLHPTLLSLRSIVEVQEANVEKMRAELVELFRIEIENINERIVVSRAIAEAEEVLNPESEPPKMATGLKEVLDTLLSDQERSAKIMADQKALRTDVTNFDELDELILFVKVRHQLWDWIVRWDEQKAIWDETPYHELNPELMATEVDEYGRLLDKLEETLPPNDVLPLLKERLERILQVWDYEDMQDGDVNTAFEIFIEHVEYAHEHFGQEEEVEEEEEEEEEEEDDDNEDEDEDEEGDGHDEEEEDEREEAEQEEHDEKEEVEQKERQDAHGAKGKQNEYNEDEGQEE